MFLILKSAHGNYYAVSHSASCMLIHTELKVLFHEGFLVVKPKNKKKNKNLK